MSNVYGEGKPVNEPQFYQIDGKAQKFFLLNLEHAKGYFARNLEYFGRVDTVTNLTREQYKNVMYAVNYGASNEQIRRNLGWDLVVYNK